MMRNDTDGATKAARLDSKSEIRLVPAWAWVLAALVYLGIQLGFLWLLWPGESHPPGALFRMGFPLFIGLLPAFFVLLVGYVNVDAGRRGMSRALWTAIVILVPNGIGFIIYYLVREPIRAACPRCGASVSFRANYCPNCAYAFRPTCPQCRSALGEGDRFCPNCGYQTRQDAGRVQG